jgi:WS/DGAT/MGAT family acyltransferase
MLRKFTLDLTDEDNALRESLGVEKQLTWSDPFPLEDLKRLGKATSSTVNDVALTLIAGALNRYLTTQGRPVTDIRAVVPFNLRPLDEPLPRRLGNMFGMVFVDLPVTVVDPRERLTVVRRQMNDIKASQEGLVVYGAFTAVGGRTPKQVGQAWMDLFARKASAVITNIAGPRDKLAVAGVPLTGFMLWVPASGSIGIGLSIVSYDGSVTLGVAVDPNIVPDSEGLLEALRDEMADLAHLS